MQVGFTPAQKTRQRAADGSTPPTGLLAKPFLRQQGAAPELARPLSDVMVIGQCQTVLFSDQIGMIWRPEFEAIAAWQRMGNCEISREDLPEFVRALTQFMPLDNIQLPKTLKLKRQIGTALPILELGPAPDAWPNASRSLQAKVLFHYDLGDVGLDDPRSGFWQDSPRTFVQRDAEAENQRLAQLQAFPLNAMGGAGEEPKFQIEATWLPELTKQLTEQGWEVRAAGRRQRLANNWAISVSSNQDWFDVQATVSFDGLTVPLPDLLAAARQQSRTVLLDDGTEGVLPEQWLLSLQPLTDLATEVDGQLQLTPSQALMLDLWLDQQFIEFDDQFRQWRQRLNRLGNIRPLREPRSFRGELRGYQRETLGWFRFLEGTGLGGCLADDMGLGKTVQVLAQLEKHRIQAKRSGSPPLPSIVVVPKSLVFNWCAEAARFTPNLKVVDYTGGKRSQVTHQIAAADLVVTTYATMRNDIAALREQPFHYAILDEAQAIKNPASLANKAARLLQARHRLAMTGTPIENHLGDLWALLDFLNPGMMGSLRPSYFTGQDDQAKERLTGLSRALKPLILRRTKRQVLTELPEKTEQTIYCELRGQQRRHYDDLKNIIRSICTNEFKKSASDEPKSRFWKRC